MADREYVALGTAAQTPTRERAHQAGLLHWDADGLLFDPGEGAQRQLLLADQRSTRIRKICITHFHGDHCLGLPGVLQRLQLDQVDHPIDVWFPAETAHRFEHLLHASESEARVDLRVHPVEADGPLLETDGFSLEAMRLDHRIPAFGYRLVEPDSTGMVQAELDRVGLEGPVVGELERRGEVEVGGRTVTLDEVSEPRPGQRFAYVMDTRLCDAAFALAEGADLLVCEATFSSEHAALADRYTHLTAAEAARVAAESGVRTLVLTHYSQRYPDEKVLLDEAREIFPDTVAARDLQTIPVPPRSR